MGRKKPKLKDYVGLPFKVMGRSVDGVDCYGLLWLVYRDMRGIELPPLTNQYDCIKDDELLSTIVKREMRDCWQEVGQELPFDAILLKMAGQPVHVGVVVGDGMMLHIKPDEKATSVIESYKHSAWKSRVGGFYRFRDGA